jgi:hypothetical protein
MGDLFKFSVATGVSDLAAARALRVLRYEPRFPGQESWWLDSDRDSLGTVFLLRQNQHAVATARIMRITGCKPEIGELGHLPAGLADDPKVWEFGRLASIPGDGSGLPYTRLLYAWSTQWASLNLPIEAIVSYCQHERLPGFLACGAEIVEGPYDIPNRGNGYYTIVYNLSVGVRCLRSLGFDRLLDATARGQTEFGLAELIPAPAGDQAAASSPLSPNERPGI